MKQFWWLWILTNGLIVVETLAALLAIPSSVDHVLQQHTRPILGIGRLLVQDLHDGETCVETDKVGKLQRTHGHVGAVLHNGVNGVAVSDTGLEADDGLVDIRHEDTVGEEAGRVGRYGCDLAHLLAELDGSVEGVLAGLETTDDLDTLLHGDGVHEVGGNDAGRSRGVGGISRRGGGDTSD